MNSLRDQAEKFLENYGMHHSSIDFESVSSIFIDEMIKGLKGESSSLKMIPTYIKPETNVQRNKRVTVIDAGGTNFRVATVYFDDNYEPVIEKYANYSMPGVDEEVSKEQFFNIIVDYILNTDDIKENIGFCFSYPTEIFPSKDGRLIKFCKEVKAPEVEGQMIGENLIYVLSKRGVKVNPKVVLLNDTVATLLAGLANYRNIEYDNYIGFILGTGTNCCYVERNSEIKKLKNIDPDDRQIVNVESGAFGKAPRGRIDESLDSKTVDPGDYKFEKMISGGYFGNLCLETFKVASEEGLFSSNFSSTIQKVDKLETKDINDFLINSPSGKSDSVMQIINSISLNDHRVLLYIIDNLIERAAKLTAINIGSVIIKSGSGGDPIHPILITAEGSTFYGLKGLKDRVTCYLNDFIKKNRHRYYNVVKVENATLIGAAIAGLTN